MFYKLLLYDTLAWLCTSDFSVAAHAAISEQCYSVWWVLLAMCDYKSQYLEANAHPYQYIIRSVHFLDEFCGL